MNLRRLFNSNIFAVALMLLSVIAFSSCHHDDDPQPPKTPTKENTHRTVLVYMLAASNGLGASAPRDYDIQDIKEMLEAAKAGDLGDGRLLVFHSSTNGKQVLKEITPEGIDTLKIYDASVLPQTSQRMSEAFDDMEAYAPAADYGLVLWGHGTGWLQDGIEEPASDIQTYAYGSEHNDKWKMNITTFADVIEKRPFSFLYMDCCYMASVEVVYQLRKAVETIVAYPTEVLAYGMPYEKNVKYLFSDTPDLVQTVKNTMDYYLAMPYYDYQMCTVSVINTQGLDRLAQATRRIYEMNTTGIPAGYTPQPYKTGNNCYYFDFGSYVRALDCDPDLLAEFEDALAEVIIYEDATEHIWGTLPINEHSGLSTFIMKSDDDIFNKNYNQLDWCGDVAAALIK